MKSLLIVLAFVAMPSWGLFGQIKQNSTSVSGVVMDALNASVPGVLVRVKDSAIGAVTNAEGVYSITDIAPGTYVLHVSAVGHIPIEQSITIKANEHVKIDFQLVESTLELEEIVVQGKSEATLAREQAFAVEVLESKKFKNLSTNANDLLGKISGVNIRQSGGLGSAFSISLNGLSDNQVRLFLDGVPMEYFGSALSLNNFAANLIQRIEVYKGVVPIHLSSDALGGAINIVTNNKVSNFLDASYSIGSYGTHIGALNTQYHSKKSGFTVRLKSFYNQAENNYKVPIKLVDFENGGKEDTHATEVERFHDAYQSKMIWLESGVMGKPYADQLFVGVLLSENEKEIQQPANAIGEAKIPYGAVTSEESKTIVNFSYKKSGALQNKLDLSAYFVGVFSEQAAIDTSSYRFDWFGNAVLKADKSTGEIENRKTHLLLDTENYLANANAGYQIHPRHTLAINYSLNALRLQGSDQFKAQNNTQFGKPSTVSKQVLGLAYTNQFFNNRLKNSLFGKGYDYAISSIETNYQGTDEVPFDNATQYVGFGATSTFQIKKVQLKASFEQAVRFPEVIELFGDGLNYVPNPALQPEKSLNYNLGFRYNSTAKNPFAISLNGFVRDAEDFILAQVQGIKVIHVNNGKVLSKGVDVSGSYAAKSGFQFNFNGTYLDLRNNNPWRNGTEGVPNALYKVRVPNVPYLFGNVLLSFRKEELLRKRDLFSASITENYVHEFFYRWENIASQDKGIVPSQWTTDLELVYSLQSSRYNASLGVYNLFDAAVYDNYLQLRPGRTFSFKLRYFIN